MECHSQIQTRCRLLIAVSACISLYACSTDKDSDDAADVIEAVDSAPETTVPEVTVEDTRAKGTEDAQPEDTVTPPRIPFQEISVSKVYDNGRTLPVNLEIPTSVNALALRVSPVGKGDYSDTCYTLDNMNDESGTTWIPEYKGGIKSHNFSVDATHRAYVNYGSGFFVFPNNGLALTAKSVDFTVSLRDCITKIPAEAPFNKVPESVLIEVATWEVPDAVGVIDVHIVVASDNSFEQDDLAKDTLLATAFEHTRERYDKGELTLNLKSLTRIPTPVMDLEFSNSNRDAIDAIYTEAAASIDDYDEANSVLVILPPCVKWVDDILQSNKHLAGHVPRIPGGFAQQTGADAVFLAADSCNLLESGLFWDKAADLGNAMAHEMGHFLGLYHVQENDGVEDHIEDTTPDKPNLMAVQVLDYTEPTEFTAQQLQVLRLNPLVQYGEEE